MSMSDKPIVEYQQVCKNFNVPGKGVLKAVNNVSFQLYPGETLGIVGESGCGKTTLGRLLVKLYEADSGEIFYNGKPIAGMSQKEKLAYRKDVQMIFQDPYASLDPLSVVGDSIAEGLEIHRMGTKSEREKRVVELLEMVGLNESHANRFPHEFSGGQRQRIGIARTLAVDPKVVVCDEPISALDVSIQAQVVNLLMRLQKERGLSYLFITHDLSMVKQISDRIAVMYLGSIVEIAPKEQLYSNHLHPYTHALLSAIPIPDPVIERSNNRIPLSGDVPSPVDLGNECPFCKRCMHATEKCFAERPTAKEVAPGHIVACHHMGIFRHEEN